MRLNKAVDGLISSLSSVGFKNGNIKIASYDISGSTNRDEEKKNLYGFECVEDQFHN